MTTLKAWLQVSQWLKSYGIDDHTINTLSKWVLVDEANKNVIISVRQTRDSWCKVTAYESTCPANIALSDILKNDNPNIDFLEGEPQP